MSAQHRREHDPDIRGLTFIETLLVLFLVAILALFVGPIFFSRSIVPGAQQTKQINNIKQITLACQLFASDHNGIFPNGKFDKARGSIRTSTSADTAEACFNDLLKAGNIEVEKIFWNPQQTTQCAPRPPDEDGTLRASENCFDYIPGLYNSSPDHLPFIFEASDGGTGTRWTKSGGHPWDVHVIVAYVDGSASKENLIPN